jgi:hypothetical protein
MRSVFESEPAGFSEPILPVELSSRLASASLGFTRLGTYRLNMLAERLNHEASTIFKNLRSKLYMFWTLLTCSDFSPGHET